MASHILLESHFAILPTPGKPAFATSTVPYHVWRAPRPLSNLMHHLVFSVPSLSCGGSCCGVVPVTLCCKPNDTRSALELWHNTACCAHNAVYNPQIQKSNNRCWEAMWGRKTKKWKSTPYGSRPSKLTSQTSPPLHLYIFGFQRAVALLQHQH